MIIYNYIVYVLCILLPVRQLGAGITDYVRYFLHIYQRFSLCLRLFTVSTIRCMPIVASWGTEIDS